MKNITLIIIFSLVLVFIPSCKKNNDFVYGVWWWNDSLEVESNLNFLQKNNVNEIYYCTDSFGDETNNFIKLANKKGMKVYLLTGRYEWLLDETKLHKTIENYIKYQEKYNNKFLGIHLDIEPHQHPEFDEKREELIVSLITLTKKLKEKYKEISFDFDIPFWLDDIITFNNEKKEAFKFMIDYANRVHIMSYRDSASKIYDISKEEIEYASSNEKDIILGLETDDNEYDYVTFYEEGNEYMNEEISKLKAKLSNNIGICIHHMKTWNDNK